MPETVRWYLELGAEVIARIADGNEYEFPWTCGRLVESPDFERFRTYFTDPDDWKDDDPVTEELCREVQSCGGFVLRDLQTGEVYHGIRLNQRAESVWFRIG